MSKLFPKVIAGSMANITADRTVDKYGHYLFKSPTGMSFTPIMDLIELIVRWYYILTTRKFKLEVD